MLLYAYACVCAHTQAHSTSNGSNHVPSRGSPCQIIRWDISTVWLLCYWRGVTKCCYTQWWFSTLYFLGRVLTCLWKLLFRIFKTDGWIQMSTQPGHKVSNEKHRYFKISSRSLKYCLKSLYRWFTIIFSNLYLSPTHLNLLPSAWNKLFWHCFFVQIILLPVNTSTPSVSVNILMLSTPTEQPAGLHGSQKSQTWLSD